MGVLKSPANRQSVKIEDIPIDYRDYVFDSDPEFATDIENDDAQAICDIISQDEKRKKKTRQERTLRRFQRAAGKLGADGVNVKRNMGARKRRRVENAHLIMDMTDRDDICEDYSDMVPNVVTAFTRLFLDSASMKIWQKFMDATEEEQEDFLEKLDENEASTANEYEHVLGGKHVRLPKAWESMTNEEKRSYHPAYSGKACYDRLLPKFKSALTKKRGVPYQMIDDIEHRLRDFFDAEPTGVWIDMVEGPHTRIFVHAVANYLSLSSSSIIGDTGGKMIEIRSRKKIFMPPYEYLVAYLHRLQGKSLCVDDGKLF